MWPPPSPSISATGGKGNLMMDPHPLCHGAEGNRAGWEPRPRAIPSVLPLPRLLSAPASSRVHHGFYTVLVEGDDPNEPIADARGILDGHIVLTKVGGQNHSRHRHFKQQQPPHARLVEEKHRVAAHLKELMAAMPSRKT